MRAYEAMFIIKPDLVEEQFKKVTSDLQEVIKKNNGEIVSSEKWLDRRALAYEIRVPATGGSVKYSEGIYHLINFKVDPSTIEKLNHSFKLNENIIRVLITVKD